MRKLLLSLTLVSLAGCQLAPTHERPALPVTDSYPHLLADGAETGAEAGVVPAEMQWRSFFADPQLQVLIEQALVNNRDLQAALYRIEETRGLYGVQLADRYPSLGLGAEMTRGRTNTGAQGVQGGSSAISESYFVGLNVSAFELDFWGRVANLSSVARAEYLASIEAQRAFRLSLISDVASTYLGLREAVERIELAEATVVSRREGLRIAKVRLDAGITSALDYAQAEALLTQAETQLAAIMLTRAQNQNLLALLTGGVVAEPLPAPLTLAEQSSPPALDAGLPSSLLLSRPDIIAAELRLQAARANIGVARAAFFPQVSLTGRAGYASSEFSNLVSSSNEIWSIGPSITLPLFDYGRNRGNLTVAQARDNLAVVEYERTIQVAFNEVADALAGRRYLADQVEAQERNEATLQRVVDLARQRYEEGVVNYIEVLDAERSLFDAQQSSIQIRRAEVQNLVALYIALGGGTAVE
ncbi:MAG: efflux transporter outer membrane subunit [Pseudomonas sp.]